MEILNLDLELIEVGKRLRAVDPDRSAMLAESIRERGLDAPIRVTEANAAGRYRLIAGGHRLDAVRQLGLPTIAAIPFSGSQLQAELMEVEENLVRTELNELDRAAFLARHKELWLALYPSAKAGGDRRKKANTHDEYLPQHPLAERFSAAIAKKLGLSEATVNRAARRHDSLSPEIRERLANTWIAHNGAAIDDLIGRGSKPLTEVERNAVLDLLLDPANKVRRVEDALRQLRKLPPPDTSDDQLNKLKALWKRTGAKAQREFRAFLNAQGGN